MTSAARVDNRHRDELIGIASPTAAFIGIVDRAARLRCDGEKMIGETGTVLRSEKLIGDHEAARERPIVRYLIWLILAVVHQPVFLERAGQQIESIHLPVIHSDQGRQVGMRDIQRNQVRRWPEDGEAPIMGLALRDPIDPGKRAEIVIEGVIFLQNEDHMLDSGGSRRQLRIRFWCEENEHGQEAKNFADQVSPQPRGTTTDYVRCEYNMQSPRAIKIPPIDGVSRR